MSGGLSANNVGQRFGRKVVLDGASLAVPRGVTALIGQNGAGKTTLIRVLAGLQRPDSGTLAIDGSGGTRAMVGLMPQFTETARWLTVSTYLRYAAYLAGSSWRASATEARRLITLTGLEEHVADRSSTLSGGQKRRLALAAALAGDPHNLLLDEPTAGLDPIQRDDMVASIANLGSDRAVLISTHIVEDVATVADRLVLLHGGRCHTFETLAAFVRTHGIEPREQRPSPEELRLALRAALATPQEALR